VYLAVALMKRLWALLTSRRVRIGLVLTALALGGLIVGGVRLVGAGNGKAASPPLRDCGRGVPPEKCNASLGPPLTTGTNPAIPPPPAFWPSPDQIQCGPAFFSSSTQQQLTDSFGNLSCFRFNGRNEWIVVGDGLAASGDVGAPGGGIVAVARCNAADSACLDPNAKHDFASFTVSHPPLSASWPLRLQATFGGRLLYVSNANCGLFTFNVVSGRWYGHAPADVDGLMHGAARAAVAAPANTPGREAIGKPAPATVAASCG
jgi:hypothetical protein